MEQESHIILQIKNELSELKVVTDQLVNLIERYQLSKQQSHDIFMVVDELLSNIIGHAYADDKAHFIDVEITVANNMFRLLTRDDGVAFDMSAERDADTSSDLENRAIGGLGLFFVKKIVDKMTYQREDDKNVLIVEKFYLDDKSG